MQATYLVCLFILAGFSIVGSLSKYFDDNLMQRIGLSFIGFASIIEIWLSFGTSLCCKFENIHQVFVLGVFVYSIGTVIKVYKYRHHVR